MTIDKVIKLGDISWWDGVMHIPWYMYIVPILLIIWGGVVYHKNIVYYDVWDYSRAGTSRLGWGIISLLCLVVFGGMVYHDDLVEQWKKNVAYPYIQSLPDEKNEVVFVKIETKIDNRYGWYIFPHAHRLTPLTISFKSNQGVETYTNWFDASMELSNETKPYITLKRLDRDLGNDLNAGIYNPSIYLPSSYKFTDIK